MTDSNAKSSPNAKPLSLRRETVRVLKVKTQLAAGEYFCVVGSKPAGCPSGSAISPPCPV